MSKKLSALTVMVVALIITPTSHAFDFSKLKDAAKQLQNDLDPNQAKSSDNNKATPLPASIPGAQTPAEAKPQAKSAENACIELKGMWAIGENGKLNHCFSSENVKYKGEAELQGFSLGAMNTQQASQLVENFNKCQHVLEPIDPDGVRSIGLYDAYSRLSKNDQNSMLYLRIVCEDAKTLNKITVLSDNAFLGYDAITKYEFNLTNDVESPIVDAGAGYIVAAIDKYGNKYTKMAFKDSGKTAFLKWEKPNGELILAGFSPSNRYEYFKPLIELSNSNYEILTIKNMIERRIKRSEQEKAKKDAEQKNFKPSL